ncbi:peptidoglycan D,D-transpeptidase FtsI family protein [Aliarcobacter butzleri]|uniref:Penicillin-binding protein 2 n=1 Tax=Aliarcobacter butzleri TaxID=28197 RepID=A0AAW6VIG3_9BACT|nr:penicillin-binding protein 2 [Aliarcobacter butzleri]MCP3650654.1 penicillin-binding protein 2 [Arcobacter sp. DNRA7]KLD97250.1 cell division protein FtsW [Aliarcobacter butzleri L349]MCG3658403.1 penicillin-binding protein 2 [Aliarcobacter butzleri]MCG3681973.1 penicillin-binding protein 2 [Aliarcobacter butzleri]MCR1816828.1 penicillin-binding protein 2 [Aliarcobacter butzleri]
MSSNEIEKKNKTKKIVILFTLIFLALLILMFSIFRTMNEKRHLPSLKGEKNELAVRGDIISEDNFKIASSKKLYRASIDTRHLDPDKKELFLTLFSIYSGIDYKTLKTKLEEGEKTPGNLVLSYSIDSRSAKNLKELDFKLRQLDVFTARQVNGSRIVRSLTISESGEKRTFSYNDTLTPVVGYISKFESDAGKTKVNGIKGLENSYNKYLNDGKDGILQGYRDVLSYISFNRTSVMTKREDGYALKLNIPLKLQKNNETTLDNHKKRLSADEIMVTIMESRTGKILSLASSNRFNPEKIRQEDIGSLNVNAVEYQFEPGSIVKPLSISLVMDKGLVKSNETFSAYNFNSAKGAYPIGKFFIKDDHKFSKHTLSLDDIVIFSSNIGTLQIAQRLTGPEFFEGMKKFGFTRKTGIDLPYEKKGVMPKLWQFSVGDKEKRDNIYKATVSFGQGMTATFIQLIKAYSVFNNDGAMVTPKIVSYLSRDGDQNKYASPYDKPLEQVISKKTADEMKRMLIKTVNEGTGRSAKIPGLEIGGKTGTAQIAGGSGYLKKYISSFFGFVNDEKGNSYTIGVTVINPISTGPNWYYYYAAQSAAPVFKEIVQNLIKLNYLSPKVDIISGN